MRQADPAPISVIITRVLAILVTIVPVAWGILLLMGGIHFFRHPQPSNGNWPEIFPEYLLLFVCGWFVLGFAAFMALTTIGVWRRKRWAAAVLAALCVLALALIAAFHIPLYDAYIVLLLICAIFSTKAAFDLNGSSAKRFDFPLGPPPLPPPLPDFDIVDDLPKDDAEAS